MNKLGKDAWKLEMEEKLEKVLNTNLNKIDFNTINRNQKVVKK